MQRDSSAASVRRDLNLQAQDIAKLALQSVDVGVPRPRFAINRWTRNASSPRLCLLGERLGLADGQALFNDLVEERFWVRSGRNRPCVAHTDIATQ